MATSKKPPEPTGTYAFSAYGQLLRGNPHEGPVAWAGLITFGPVRNQIDGSDTVNYADESPVERIFTGTYSVEPSGEVIVKFSFTGDRRATAASASLYFGDTMKQFRM